MEQRKHYTGLTDAEVLESQKKNGVNILTSPEKDSLWKQFLEKFEDPIIIILLVALVASFGVSCYHYWGAGEGLSVFLEPVGILIAVLLATVVGFFFELSANKKFEILNQVNDDVSIKVVRNGNVCEVAKKDVVVGDIVLVSAGDEIPADGKLLEAISLQLNESTLTGEPVIKKTTNSECFDKEATYPSNQVYRGTMVVDGNGVFEVTTVGDLTEYGKVYEGSQIDTEVETPLKIQLNKLADLITKASYGIAIIIVVARLLTYFIPLIGAGTGIDWLSAGGFILNTIMIAVTVIVVAVPEGLPMSVTLSLALSMKRMLSTNNLVRQMHACETMGATTVICTDKTGTLTQNQMQVFESAFNSLADQKIDGVVGSLVKESIAVNSTAFLDYSEPTKVKTLGNPTEAALLLWLHNQGVNYLEIRENTEVVDQLTFSTERKYMATIVNSPILNKKVLYVKGAPEIVYGLSKQLEDGVSTSSYKNTFDNQLINYQNQAMRTLGFAYKIIDDTTSHFQEGKIVDDDLIFLGVVAISDPVREDVPAAVSCCMNAGINIKMVTGDTSGTAKEIGRQIGLWSDSDGEMNHITGVEFAELSDEELLKRVLDLKIISRARPMDKKRLVELLQQKGQVVAVTGDGTNDAPALNAAQVGLSMGDGTQVAKELAPLPFLTIHLIVSHLL